MGEAKRKHFSGEFNAKVAVVAIRGVKAVNEIGQEFRVHPTQVGLWKKELLEQASGLFYVKRGQNMLTRQPVLNVCIRGLAD